MIYGWGRKTKDWTMPDGRVLVCSYSYFSLMFILQLVWKRRWTLIGRDRAMDTETTRDELERIYGPGNVPDIGVFERFGALIAGGAIVGIAVVAAAWGVFASAVGLGSDTTEASGPVAEVVTSDAGPASSQSISGSSGLGVDDGPDDEPSSAAGDPATDVGDTADHSSADGSDPEVSAPSVFEQASDIVSSAAPTLMSTNIDRPTQGWSEIVIHGAIATTRFDDQTAPAGEKFVVVDYQMLGIEGRANFFDNAFRLLGGDQQFSPVAPNINRTMTAGEALNSQIVFAVPANASDFRLEAGTLDPAGDGFQSTFEFDLSPAAAPAASASEPAPDMIGEAVLASPGNLMTGTPDTINPAWSPFEVDVVGATRSAKVGPNGARPGFVFVVIEVEVEATGPLGLWQSQGFRVEADGELYGHDTDINESLSTGERSRASLLFEVPDSVFALQLEAGVPDGFEVGEQAVFDITFD